MPLASSGNWLRRRFGCVTVYFAGEMMLNSRPVHESIFEMPGQTVFSCQGLRAFHVGGLVPIKISVV